MKKRYIALGIAVIIAAVLGLWLVTRPKPLGNINLSFSEPTSSVSNFSFSANAGDRIKFSFSSKVKNGDLQIILCDSEDNVVNNLGKATALETFQTLDISDTYTLKAVYNDFTGNFKIAVYNAN